MTCIVGLVHDGRVFLGGDSAGVNSWFNQTIRADEKVFQNGPYIMGFTSSFRMGQLLRYSFQPPEPTEGEDIDKFMATKFIDGVRSCLKDGGWARVQNGEETGGVFLVGYQDRLFRVDMDYQVGSLADGYCSVGCGGEIACGAMYATKDIEDPNQRITIALEAAERFSAGVAGPFHIVSTKKATTTKSIVIQDGIKLTISSSN
ncbi:hypothetical protein [Marininema halotolerans]|uniref:Proteasome subunit beta n=1 Tax=Marininema halotolerans TaxID=1155944 RepID=A0A1I6QJH5_9BACL|nr:hypothetical protein [Marininema halotolerans]SFS52574.1 hypothetical protein SAMN05444972_103190 [Marininema halotolerans]